MLENISTTIVSYENIPVMVENGWHVVVFNPVANAPRSTGFGSAVMRKSGDWRCRAFDGLQRDLRDKRGED